jgi:Transglycosylase-like domain
VAINQGEVLIWRYLTARTVLLTVLASLVFPASTRAVTAIGCGASPAPRLCTIRAYHARANHYRVALGAAKIPLEPGVFSMPHRRGYYAWLWDRRRDRAKAAWLAAPWLHAPFYAQAMCIHSKESIDWHEAGSPGGGMQFIQSTWTNYVVRGYEFAAEPSQATPSQQLHAAYRLVRHDGGWHEWSTHSLCGL